MSAQPPTNDTTSQDLCQRKRIPRPKSSMLQANKIARRYGLSALPVAHTGASSARPVRVWAWSLPPRMRQLLKTRSRASLRRWRRPRWEGRGRVCHQRQLRGHSRRRSSSRPRLRLRLLEWTGPHRPSSRPQHWYDQQRRQLAPPTASRAEGSARSRRCTPSTPTNASAAKIAPFRPV